MIIRSKKKPASSSSSRPRTASAARAAGKATNLNRHGFTRRAADSKPQRSRRRPVRHEISAGGVVVRNEDGNWLVALLKTEHKRGEVWVLPKGHVEPHAGETVADAAKREVEEEAGIRSLSVKNQLGVTKFSFQAEDALVKKKVHYFLMATDQKKLTPQAEEGLIDAIWRPIDQAIDMLEYDTDQEIVAKAKFTLSGKTHPAIRRNSRPTGRGRQSATRPGAAHRPTNSRRGRIHI